VPKPPHEVEQWVADMYQLATAFEALAEDAPPDKCFGPDLWDCYPNLGDPSPETLPQRVTRQGLERQRAAADRAAEAYLQRHNAKLQDARRLATALWNYSELRPTTRALQRLIDDTEGMADVRDVGGFAGQNGPGAKYKALGKRWDEEANKRSRPRRKPLRLRL